MSEFQFDPIDGFKNATSFPNPSTETEARTQVQSLLDQARNAINNVDEDLQANFATKLELAAAIISSAFPAGTIGDDALSNDAGQIKARLTDHINIYEAFVATKGQPGGLAAYDDVLNASVYTTNTPVLKTTIAASSPNFIALLAAGTWGTIYTYSFTKVKGQKFIGLSQDQTNPYTLGSYVYNTSATYDSSGSVGTPGTRVYINGVLKAEFTTSGDLLIDISDIPVGGTVALRIDIYNNQGTAKSWHWWQAAKVKLNDIFKIAY